MAAITGLLIDIDDTLVSFIEGYPNPCTSSLLNVFRSAGADLAQLPLEEVDKRIEKVKQELWWCWNDFISEFNLSQSEFWDYALQVESKYLLPAEPQLLQSLQLLHDSGLKLFITSNNPNPGIRHKMRVAGIPDSSIDCLIEDILGATVMQNMKWDIEYWNKVISATGLSPESLAVIGDSYNDDYCMPHRCGIQKTFLLNRNQEHNNQPKQDGLVIVDSIKEIVELLTGSRVKECTV